MNWNYRQTKRRISWLKLLLLLLGIVGAGGGVKLRRAHHPTSQTGWQHHTDCHGQLANQW